VTHPIQPAPDWFDRLWEEHKEKLPLLFRSEAMKRVVRVNLETVSREAAKYATTPDGIRVIVAFAKISAILKGSQGVLDAPNPSPEQVADAVEKLVERLKS